MAKLAGGDNARKLRPNLFLTAIYRCFPTTLSVECGEALLGIVADIEGELSGDFGKVSDNPCWPEGGREGLGVLFSAMLWRWSFGQFFGDNELH